MAWAVAYAVDFESWWRTLTSHEQESIDVVIRLLEARGPLLGFPYSSGILGSKHRHMRELRIHHAGNPYRILYAFDSRRIAVLLIGGRKAGDDRWYARAIPRADGLYDEHILALKREGLIDG